MGGNEPGPGLSHGEAGGPDDAEEIVTALYRGILRREPDPAWLRANAEAIRRKGIKASLPDIIGRFMAGATGLVDMASSLLTNSSGVHLVRLIEDFAGRMPPGSLVLDAGAASAPYGRFFGHVRYETADIRPKRTAFGQTTYVCDICEHIPVDDGHFDFIIFNQVMEHLKEPGAALAEMFRVLKPGGVLLTTTPLFYEEHDQPHDYYRYTQYGHRYLFEKAGYNIEKIDWLEGFFGTCGYMLQTIYKYAPGSVEGGGADAAWARSFLTAIKPLCLVAAGSFYRLDLLWKVTNVGFPKNYVIWAAKPAEP